MNYGLLFDECYKESDYLTTTSRSDALMLFGVTGDLAHKMTFPAFQAMAKRGALKVPLIGVAFPSYRGRDLELDFIP